MFDRFNDTARRVIAGSGEESRALGHTHLSTTHLLLALTDTLTGDGELNKAAQILQDVYDVAVLREQILAPMPRGVEPTGFGHLPYSEDFKLVLQASLRASETLGDRYIGPEHLLAGLAEITDSTAGSILGPLGLTFESVLARIKDSTPVVHPTRMRSYAVYLATGSSLTPRNPRLYPSLERAKAAHPDEDFAAFQLPLREGEFFKVTTTGSAAEVDASFASYPDAFSLAESLREEEMDPVISILTPLVKELRGRDSRGHDVVLGKAVEYTSSRPITRLTAATPTDDKEPIHV